MTTNTLDQLLAEGAPEAWASPDASLRLLGGALSLEQAQLGAVTCLERGGAPFQLLTELAQTWWQRPDPTELAALLGRLAARAGHGSREHRRAVLVLCLCARTVLPHAGRWADLLEGCLADVESWSWGDSSIELAPLLSRIEPVCRAAQADVSAPGALSVANAVYALVQLALHTRGDDIANTAQRGLLAVVYAAGYAPSQEPAASCGWGSHLATLADLIRAAVPICPLLEAPRGG